MNFAEKMGLINRICPGTISSGYRDRKLNTEVGGSWDSMHQLGLAVDVVLNDRDNDLKLFIRMAVRLGLFVYDEYDHVHVHEIFNQGIIWNK